jgi:hypothetical protein
MILFSKANGGDTYSLYESDDGLDYDVVSGANFMFFGGFGITMVTSLTDKYYYVTAKSGDDESPPGPVIFAEPDNYSSSGDFIDVPSDGEVAVSQTPNVVIDPVAGTNMYAIAVYEPGPDGGDIWNIILRNGATSVTYGDTGPNIITAQAAASLTSDTEYGLVVEAINANNWGFMRDDNSFTTEN